MNERAKSWISKLDSLKVKLSALFLLLAIIPLALITFLLLSQFTSVLERQTSGERERIAAREATFINDWIHEQVASVEKLMNEQPGQVHRR